MPPNEIDLATAWRKLQRGKTHIDQLRLQIWIAGHPNPYLIPLKREYDAKDRAIVVRVERVIQISGEWPVIVGDAAHNLRSALNHLAWQLALKRYKGTIPGNVVKQVQFPIVSEESKWKGHSHIQHMNSADAQILKRYQPFTPRPPGALDPLEGLALLNDIDKHRLIHLLYTAVSYAEVEFAPGAPGMFVDGEEDFERVGPQGMPGFEFTYFGGREPRPNDEVMRVYVRPTGPNPDTNFEITLTSRVAMREGWDVLEALDVMAIQVGHILAEFGPVPEGVSLVPIYGSPEERTAGSAGHEDPPP